MGTPESRVKAEVKKILNELGAYHIWPVPTGYGSTVVDCYACVRGHFVAIECKATHKDKPTPRQKLVLGSVIQAKGHSFIAHSGNLDNLRAFLEAICGLSKN